MNSIIKSDGIVYVTIEWKDGKLTKFSVPNRVLRTGRIAIANSLANNFGSSYGYFINAMSFGSGGTLGGESRYVDDTREGLFGPTVITKPVISSINPDVPYQGIFTSVLTYEDAVGDIINEMALRMYNGEYFSMATYGDITKTSQMQITWNWTLTHI